MADFYRAEKLNDRMTAVISLTGEIMYLISGEKKSVLIDTCVGAGNLRAFVETLTDKPLTVLLTHGHIDHAMGAPEFADGCEIYMNHADAELYLRMNDVEGRKGYVMAGLGGKMPEGLEDTFLPPTELDFKDLKDGDSFDLGGTTVEVYALPGHTPGSMVMLVPEERILILGDACNNATFLFDGDSLTVEEYRENLIEVQNRLEGRFDSTCLCHHVIKASKDMINSAINVCDDIMKGNTDDVPFDFMGQQVFVAKKASECFVRLDGGEGNIIYNKEKIHKKEVTR